MTTPFAKRNPCEPAAAELHPGAFAGDEVFSIIIPTWNNLDFLKLCVRSIRENSVFPHQIVLHVNDGSDGTAEWAAAEGIAFSRTPGNAGVCFAVNATRPLVRTDYILYMNDDMYVCPGWDRALKEEIDAAGTKFFFLSATMIEPYPTNSKPVIGARNYGTTTGTFEEKRLLAEFASLPKEDWNGATRPPNVVHRDIWDLVGGYSVEFSPGMYSDPDFSMKLWQAGVRLFKGVARSRVYHFVSKSVGRITPNNGRRQFLRKWGMTPSTFYRFFLKKGEPFTGPLADPPATGALRGKLLRDKLQGLF
jgi:glycosyltransferase involved in cell wall biosynthesis